MTSSPAAENKGRLFWVDLVRASAALMVIVLHAGSPYITRPGRFSLIQEEIIVYFESWVRVCVPLFFMVSGYLFLRKDHSEFTRPMMRAISPLIFYSVIAAAYNFAFRDISLSQTLNNFLFAKPFYHLWFFYTLIGIYTIFYFVRPRPLQGWNGAVFVICVMIVLGFGTEQLLSQYFHKSSRVFMDGTFINYLLYAFLGYYLATSPQIERKMLICSAAALAIITLAIAILTKTATAIEGKYDPIFHLYQSPLVIVASALTFLVLREIGPMVESHAIPRRSVLFIAKYSLGIYGIYAFVLDYLRFHTPMRLINQNAVAHIAMMTALTLVISLMLARLISRFDPLGLFVTGQPEPRPVKATHENARGAGN